MTPDVVLTHEFVEFVPDELNERTLYVSIRYKTVVHLCCCGCGREVVTPLSPTDWKLTFDGASISLHPSIGSWSLPCKSHYWIDRNRAKWAPRWSQAQIDAGRAREALAKKEYFDSLGMPSAQVPTAPAGSDEGRRKESLWRKLTKWLFG
jgi:hypothetical protein